MFSDVNTDKNNPIYRTFLTVAIQMSHNKAVPAEDVMAKDPQD